MRARRFGCLAIGFCLTGMLGLAAPARAGALCRVADPTGTALNLRTAPNMSVIGQARNGARVEIVEEVASPDGKRWAFLRAAADGRALGWAFRDFLDCR